MLDKFFGLFSYDIGIDLGTANTLVHVRGKGVVLREPSIVAQHKKTKRILAIGTEAKRMLGRTPATIVAVKPLSDGVISDFDMAAAMLKHYIHLVHDVPSIIPKLPRPRVVVGIPSGVTEVERRAVQEAALAAGARQAYLIEEPMAMAIGAGLPVEDPSGIMVVDIGGGTTEMAVISLGGIVINKSVRIAGNELDEAIINYMRLKYGILLGERTAEDLKIALGSALPERDFREKGAENEKIEIPEKYEVVRGRDLETGLPRSFKVSETEVREALAPIISQIVEDICDLVEETPPELVADIMERGITMGGGGSQLRGLDRLVAERTKMPVWVADDPMTCVVRGCGKVLEELDLLNKVRVTGGLR